MSKFRDRILALAAEMPGALQSEIAEKAGCSQGRVSQVMRADGHPKRKRGPKRSDASQKLDERIISLRAQGLRVREIAEATGQSVPAVKSRLMRSARTTTDAWRAANRYRAQVHALWREGLCISEIKARLGSANNTVISELVREIATEFEIRFRAKHKMLTKNERNMSFDLRAKIDALWESGFSQRDIAEELGIPRTTIASYLQRSGRKAFTAKRLTAAVKAEALRLYRSGMSLLEVAKQLGVSDGAVRHLAIKAGVMRSRSEASVLRYRRPA